MNALAMPISSRAAADRLCACFLAKSPRIFEERSATSWYTLASSSVSFGSAGCISHDAIRSLASLRVARVVKVVQVGYRLAHGEESLVRVERPLEQHRQQLAGAFLAGSEHLLQIREAVPVMALELRHALVRAAKGLAVRRQDQHVGGQVAVARDRLQEQAQRVALGVDRPDADVGRDGGEQHVSSNYGVYFRRKQRQVLGRMPMADDGSPAPAADLDLVALDDAA